MRREDHHKGIRFGIRSGNTIKKCPTCTKEGIEYCRTSTIFETKKGFTKASAVPTEWESINKSERKRLVCYDIVEEKQKPDKKVSNVRKANNEKLWNTKYKFKFRDFGRIQNHQFFYGDLSHKHAWYSCKTHYYRHWTEKDHGDGKAAFIDCKKIKGMSAKEALNDNMRI
eukprot:TRINITY_DN91987_c0_g1_i1.p1 TRINITY_DN91987_c0_g1~~TRINITY_DN91987_c0_g1_i1.p1  ORF type:complete len:197 (+),score=12.80 TRINITY_DN91987_c0_g1_i1:82-591(+)